MRSTVFRLSMPRFALRCFGSDSTDCVLDHSEMLLGWQQLHLTWSACNTSACGCTCTGSNTLHSLLDVAELK